MKVDKTISIVSRALFSLIATVSLSCSQDVNYVGTQVVRADCLSDTASTFFFPTGSFWPSRSDMDTFVQSWCSEPLEAMGEPSLSCGVRPDSYRFTWIPSFHGGLCVRIELLEGGSGTLTASTFEGATGISALSNGSESTRDLSVEQVDEIIQLFNDWGFWSVPIEDSVQGLDGAQWVFEGRTGAMYKVVSRWSPEGVPEAKLGRAGIIQFEQE